MPTTAVPVSSPRCTLAIARSMSRIDSASGSTRGGTYLRALATSAGGSPGNVPFEHAKALTSDCRAWAVSEGCSDSGESDRSRLGGALSRTAFSSAIYFVGDEAMNLT